MDFKTLNSETGESEENWTLNRKEIEHACSTMLNSKYVKFNCMKDVAWGDRSRIKDIKRTHYGNGEGEEIKEECIVY